MGVCLSHDVSLDPRGNVTDYWGRQDLSFDKRHSFSKCAATNSPPSCLSRLFQRLVSVRKTHFQLMTNLKGCTPSSSSSSSSSNCFILVNPHRLSGVRFAGPGGWPQPKRCGGARPLALGCCDSPNNHNHTHTHTTTMSAYHAI